MKNRSCPARHNCRSYICGSCEDCAIGDTILRLRRKIERLQDENTKLKERATKYETLFDETEGGAE